jgi:hypothetical protein
MKAQLARFWWTLRAALLYVRRVDISFPIAWEFADSLYDTYNVAEDGDSPSDAVWNDLSYWD